MTSSSPVMNAASPPATLQSLPNELLYLVLDRLSLQDLTGFGQVNQQARSLVTKRSSTITPIIIRHETERLKNAMQSSFAPKYGEMPLLAALRRWSTVWGRPHHTFYCEAVSQFGRDFEEHLSLPNLVCLAFGWRRQFWGRLAEFLLHISDLVIHGHDRCQRGYCCCGKHPGFRSDWIQERAYYSFHDASTCGADFLAELVKCTSRLSFHFCLGGMIGRAEWLAMVQDVRATPIERLAVSKITEQSTNRQELFEVVAKRMGDVFPFTPLDLTFDEDTSLGLPKCLPGFYYLPKPGRHNKEYDKNDSGLVSVEGVRSTEAARLLWKIYDVHDNQGCSESFVQLLQARFLRALDVSDLPCFLNSKYRDGSSGTSWKNCMERYGKVAYCLRIGRNEATDSRWAEKVLPNTPTLPY